MSEKSNKWQVILFVALVAIGGAASFLALRAGKDKQAINNTPEMWDAETQRYVQQQHALVEGLIQTAQLVEARQALDDLIRAFPADPVAYDLLSRVLAQQGAAAPAYEAAVKSLELNDDNAELHLWAGTICESQLNRLEDAIGHYSRAVEIDDSSARAVNYHLALANASMKRRDADQAQFHALKVIALDSENHMAYRLLAEAAASRGQTDMAIERITIALDLARADSVEAFVYAMRRVEFLRRKGPGGRQEALESLLAIDEGVRQRSEPITEQLAMTYLSLNRPADASKVWADWFADHPQDARAAAEAGLAAHRAGDTEAAKGWLAKARAMGAHLPQVEALAQAVGE